MIFFLLWKNHIGQVCSCNRDWRYIYIFFSFFLFFCVCIYDIFCFYSRLTYVNYHRSIFPNLKQSTLKPRWNGKHSNENQDHKCIHINNAHYPRPFQIRNTHIAVLRLAFSLICGSFQHSGSFRAAEVEACRGFSKQELTGRERCGQGIWLAPWCHA